MCTFKDQDKITFGKHNSKKCNKQFGRNWTILTQVLDRPFKKKFKIFSVNLQNYTEMLSW